MHLYRRRRFQASVAAAALACLGLGLAAPAFQHRNSHKLRATALVEITVRPGGVVSSAQLTPITILDGGRFRDASMYESKPRPMALDNGIVYEAQKSGIPVGYVTINTGQQKSGAWVAQGSWESASQIQAAEARHAAPPPRADAGTGAKDERPVLRHGGARGDSQSGSSTTSTSPSSSSPATTPSPSGQPQPGPTGTETPGTGTNGADGRPTLHRGGNASSQPAASPTPASSAPVLIQPAPPPAAEPTAAPEPDEPQDAGRPRLRRRGAARPSASPPANAPGGAPPAGRPVSVPPAVATSVTQTPGTQIFVAVSDTQPNEPRSFEYVWSPGERQPMEIKMRKLALAQLPPAGAQQSENSLTNVVFRAFDVDLSNDAVMVITAELPGVRAAGGTGAAASGQPAARYIAVIARIDIEGNPQKLASSVTDSSRLDVAPRLELIDAVDVDGDGLAELLFRQYGFDQKSFVIYGVGHGSVTKVFEGASQPLRATTGNE